MTTTTQPNTDSITPSTTAPSPPSPASPDPDIIMAGRDARITVYLEPELAAVANHVASRAGIATSALVRDMMFEKLLSMNAIPQEMLIKMARRA